MCQLCAIKQVNLCELVGIQKPRKNFLGCLLLQRRPGSIQAFDLVLHDVRGNSAALRECRHANDGCVQVAKVPSPGRGRGARELQESLAGFFAKAHVVTVRVSNCSNSNCRFGSMSSGRERSPGKENVHRLIRASKSSRKRPSRTAAKRMPRQICQRTRLKGRQSVTLLATNVN